MHFGAFPPARGALEVPLVVACVYQMYSSMPIWWFLDVAGVARLHFKACLPARGAPEVPLVVFLINQNHASMREINSGVSPGLLPGLLARLAPKIDIFLLKAYSQEHQSWLWPDWAPK